MTQNATEATAPVDIDARSAVNESFAKEADAASDSRSTVVDTSTNDVRASAALATPAGEPAMVSEEKTERSKAKVALIMSALGVCFVYRGSSETFKLTQFTDGCLSCSTRYSESRSLHSLWLNDSMNAPVLYTPRYCETPQNQSQASYIYS